jgi:mono/diheme cytochrome c family protein
MLRKMTFTIFFLLIFIPAISACGSEGGASTKAVNSGEELFQQATIGSLAGCKTCHSLEPGVVIIGPSIAGIGSQAEARIAGVSAEDYLRQSILDPNAYLVEGFPANIMPNTYHSQLTEEQIEALVTYMLTLE